LAGSAFAASPRPKGAWAVPAAMRSVLCALAALGVLAAPFPLVPLAGGQIVTDASVMFEDQATSGTVIVAETELPDGGFVVIHDERLQVGDALGSVIGNSSYLEPGNHTDVRIGIDAYEGTQNLTAMAHMDTNGNQEYDFGMGGANGTADGPYVGAGGAVVDSATVTWEDDAEDDAEETDDGNGGTVGADRDGDEDNGTPGFGLVGALAALAGVALRRRR